MAKKKAEKTVAELVEEVENSPELAEKIQELKTLYFMLMTNRGVYDHPDFDNYLNNRATEYEELGGDQDTMLDITGALWFNQE